MGICGVGMSSLAGMLKQKGYTITGSDQNIYPPISTFLEKLSIPIKIPYSPSNLHPLPDLVVVGNVIRKDNPEAGELQNLKIPYLSMPQVLNRFFLDAKKSIVISGTHGKTTTSALIAWILEIAGLNPSFMIGGVARNFASNFKLDTGPYFVIEGDEYDTAFFDKGPKFLHYKPNIVIINNIEFDHADIYKEIEEIKNSFRRLIEIIPARGLLCANIDDPVVADEIKNARCPSVTYSIKQQEADFSVKEIKVTENGIKFIAVNKGKEYLKITTGLYGNHNISNILAAISIACHINVKPEIKAEAISTFQGVNRRTELLGNYQDIILIDDFAHHPTAVRETIKAVKAHHKDRRLVAVFEPRSNTSRRNIFQSAYASSFDQADLVAIPEPTMTENIPVSERFSSIKLVSDLVKKGIEAHCFSNSDDLFNELINLIKPGDLILVMSNGAFDNIQQRLVNSLKEIRI